MNAREALERASELLLALDDAVTGGDNNANPDQAAALASAWSVYAHAKATAEHVDVLREYMDAVWRTQAVEAPAGES